MGNQALDLRTLTKRKPFLAWLYRHPFLDTPLGLLYAKLSNSDTAEAVSAATYLEDLCRDLVASAQSEGARFVLKTDIENELLPTDQAIAIGLILNELVTNVLKYAFPSETKGTVIVTLKRTAGELRLTVADNGSGIDK